LNWLRLLGKEVILGNLEAVSNVHLLPLLVLEARLELKITYLNDCDETWPDQTLDHYNSVIEFLVLVFCKRVVICGVTENLYFPALL
jgi:hypothetical protein